MVALRQGDWKLVRMHDGPPREDPSPLSDLAVAELYNLKDDIGETRNLAAAHPEKVKERARVWLSWSAQMEKPRWGFFGRSGGSETPMVTIYKVNEEGKILSLRAFWDLSKLAEAIAAAQGKKYLLVVR